MNLHLLLENVQTAQGILNISFHSCIVLITGWLMVKLGKQMSAPLRSGISLATMLILLFLPFSWLVFRSQAGPGIDTPELMAEMNSAGQSMDGALAKEPRGREQSSVVSPRTGRETPPSESELSVSPLPGASWFITSRKGLIRVINGLGLIWIAGMVFLLLRLLYGLVYLSGFRRGLVEVRDNDLQEILPPLRQAFKRKKLPRVYTSPVIDSPLAVGIINPCIIIPHDLYQGITREELKSILLHEISHIHHRDHISGILQRSIIAVNWWNPLVYSISAEFSRAREYISDNYAIRDNSPRKYARCLVNLAKKTHLLGRLPATIGMATPYITLEERIKSIISKERKMKTNLKKRITLLLVFAAVVLTVFITGYNWVFAASRVEAVLPGQNTVVESSGSSEAVLEGDIHAAAAAGDIETVKRLLADNPGLLNGMDKKGFTPLHRAVSKDRQQVAALLIEKGADINAGNKNGLTPLFSALDLGLGDMARFLIAKGADVDIKGYRNWTMLHIAARCGDKEVVRTLVEKGLAVNARDSRGITPLHLVAESRDGHIDVGKFLLEQGADVDPKDRDGITPLGLAVYRGHKRLARLLIDNGADVNARGLSINKKKIKEKMLLKKRSGKVTIMNGRKVYKNKIPETSDNLLSMTLICGYADLARLMIEKGADVNGVDKEGKTPLHYAQKYQHKELIELLTAKGAKAVK